MEYTAMGGRSNLGLTWVRDQSGRRIAYLNDQKGHPIMQEALPDQPPALIPPMLQLSDKGYARIDYIMAIFAAPAEVIEGLKITGTPDIHIKDRVIIKVAQPDMYGRHIFYDSIIIELDSFAGAQQLAEELKTRLTTLSREHNYRVSEELDRLRATARNVYEIWAGSEGVPEPKTAVEAYLLQLIEQMRDEARKGL